MHGCKSSLTPHSGSFFGCGYCLAKSCVTPICVESSDSFSNGGEIRCFLLNCQFSTFCRASLCNNAVVELNIQHTGIPWRLLAVTVLILTGSCYFCSRFLSRWRPRQAYKRPDKSPRECGQILYMWNYLGRSTATRGRHTVTLPSSPINYILKWYEPKNIWLMLWLQSCSISFSTLFFYNTSNIFFISVANIKSDKVYLHLSMTFDLFLLNNVFRFNYHGHWLILSWLFCSWIILFYTVTGCHASCALFTFNIF
jgi:hypothetical protein